MKTNTRRSEQFQAPVEKSQIEEEIHDWSLSCLATCTMKIGGVKQVV